MENYVKAILYAYPRLDELIGDYSDHVKTEAYLSFATKLDSEKLTEYLIGQILEKEKLAKLKSLADKVFETLSCDEKLLLEIRYFGKRKKLQRLLGSGNNPFGSRRNYYRKQARVLKKVAEGFKRNFLSEEEFENEYASCTYLAAIKKYIDDGRDKLLTEAEYKAV